MRFTVHDSWSTVHADAWDALVGEASPFLEHAWLHGLEATGCACPATGWHPRPVTVHDGDRLVAGAPAWRVDGTRGQFVYQGHWERAAEDAGLPLHPALLLGVPFTPVTGARTLLAPDDRHAWHDALHAGLARAADGCHALHVLFPREPEARAWQRRGHLVRTQYQFHWHNDGYTSFDDFLARFRSRYRKVIRRERRAVAHLDVDVVAAPEPALVGHLWDAYADTVERYGGTDRFLRPAFFDHLAGHYRDRLRAVVARDGGRFVAGALNVLKGERMYGRYWGQHEDVPHLHFEVCYHRGVEHGIEVGLQAYEPGHGGEHKYRRGFEPVRTFSAHRFAHPGVHRSFARAAERENAWFDERITELRERSPLKG